jgi:hypothetical protein
MKYGNINVRLPDVKLEMAALDDLFAKGEITESECTKRKAILKTNHLRLIVATNGGYSVGRKQKKKKEKQTIVDMREAHQAAKLREIAASILEDEDEIEAEPVTNDLNPDS